MSVSRTRCHQSSSRGASSFAGCFDIGMIRPSAPRQMSSIAHESIARTSPFARKHCENFAKAIGIVTAPSTILRPNQGSSRRPGRRSRAPRGGAGYRGRCRRSLGTIPPWTGAAPRSHDRQPPFCACVHIHPRSTRWPTRLIVESPCAPALVPLDLGADLWVGRGKVVGTVVALAAL